MLPQQPLLPFSDRDLAQVGTRVVGVLTSGELAGHAQLDELEAAFKAFAGRDHAVAVSSGSTALMVSLSSIAARIEARTTRPTIAIPTVAHWVNYTAARLAGFDVVFAPCSVNGQMDIPRVLTELDKSPAQAIMYVGLGGALHERLGELEEACRSAGIFLVTDMSHAVGSVGPSDRQSLSYGDVSVASLGSNKLVTAGEGGIIVTSDPEMAIHMRSLRNGGRIGRTQTATRYAYVSGTYRMPELSAALACVSLQSVPERIQARSHLADVYDRVLRDGPGIRIVARAGSNFYRYLIVMVDDASRFEKELAMRDVQPAKRVYDAPVWQQGGLVGPATREGWDGAVGWSSRHVALPMHESLTAKVVEEIAKRVASAAFAIT